MRGDWFFNRPPCLHLHDCNCKRILALEELHLLDQDGVVRNAHWFLIRLVEMPFHHIMKEGVTARQDGSWDTGVCVHPTTREDTGVEVQPLPRQGLIQRNPSCQKEFSAVVLISDKEPLRQSRQQHQCWTWGSSPWLQEHLGDQTSLVENQTFPYSIQIYSLMPLWKSFLYSQGHDMCPCTGSWCLCTVCSWLRHI